MIGTEEGCWFSLKERPDGLVDYEFYRFNDKLEEGTCSEAEMCLRFDALADAAKHQH